MSQETLSQQVNTGSTRAPSALWELAFRPGFLAATGFSIVALAVWVAWLSGLPIGLRTGLTPTVWHLHEMLFGFAAAVAAAFLLTAVQTWTGLRSLHGPWLIALSLLWLSARLLLLTTHPYLNQAAVFVQGLWWLLVITAFSRLLVQARSSRNYRFIPLLLVLATLNLSLLWADLQGQTNLALHLGRTAILMFGMLVSLVGGRVIPFFTQRGAALEALPPTPRLNGLLFLFSLAGTLVYFLSHFLALPLLAAPLLMMTGFLHLWRGSRWRPLATRRIPLLWSLHLAYFFLGAGLVALGISELTAFIRFADALHLVAVGTIGSMILAMMARVSLGHTGRPLAPPSPVSLAFALVLVAAVLRFALPTLGLQQLGWQLSAGLWILAFALFLWRYLPILVAPRTDR